MTNAGVFDLASELIRFRAFPGAASAHGQIQTLAPDIIWFTPQNSVPKLKIGFLALVHGNETIGLPILNYLLQGLLSGVIKTEHEIIFGLGNLPAAQADVRFLQNDLNRCFGQSTTATPEDRRAREIEDFMLKNVDYLIDLHQTVQQTETPFFIFQYSSKSCLSHLALMNSKFPTILQFDAIGENQGLSTDEYLRSRRRFGVALELGQIGFTAEKFQTGFSVCSQFIEKLNNYESFAQLDVPFTQNAAFPLLEITGRFTAPDDECRLDPVWTNFARFTAGQILGSSKSGLIRAPHGGYVLFPKLNQTLLKGQCLFFTCEMYAVPKSQVYAVPESPGQFIEAENS